jgi:zinc/manganese transport system substrate-binding protein
MKHYAAAIADELFLVEPQHAKDFAKRRDDFLRTLAVVGRAVDMAVSMVPPERRVVFTTHDAFAYLERDHGITVLSPAGPDSTAEGSARGLAALVGRIHETKAKAVFPEAGGEDRLAHVLADEAGIGVGEPLYAGTLSGTDGPAPSFVEMWSHNVFLMLNAMTP